MRHKVIPMLFLLIFGIISNAIFSNAAIPASERAVLIAFYNSTNGDLWYKKNGWKTPPLAADGFALPGTEGTWQGISVSGNTVIAISFGQNNLSGSIPPQLGNLSNLKNLSLVFNYLSGTLPPELGNLSNLRDINLRGNQLTGPIPGELGNLSQLKNLNLSDNQLSGSIPIQFMNLANLNTVDIKYNKLSGSLPAELGNLTNLNILELCGNQLTGSIPSELGNLSLLTKLDLSDNQLNGSIPAALGNLSALEELNLFINKLSGSIPAEFAHLSNLKELRLFENQLSGPIPVDFRELSDLTLLDLSKNVLTGSLPASLGNISKLNVLDLSKNQLSGSIPAEFRKLYNLTQLYLDNNQLSGFIPPELGNLLNLGFLFLYNNQLSGIIPATFVHLTNLNWLYLHNNRLSGSIPAGFEKIPHLWYLNLSSNQLSGSIPGELGNSSSLFLLNLGNNYLSGPIPSSFTNLSNLSSLELSYNCLLVQDPMLRSWLVNMDPDWEDHQDQCRAQSEINLYPSQLYFGAGNGKVTAPQTVLVKNTGSGIFVWTATSDQSWLGVTPYTGTGSGEITITVNPSGLPEGTFTGNITVSDPNAINSPQVLPIILKIYNNTSTKAPFGEFATPLNGATVSGSIPITGWVLDDIEVKKVEIFNGVDYIGDAIFVNGARPDVEDVYSQYPLSYKAGWGYMLLTYFLPNNGSETFTISAIATDAEGNQTTLGSKTITCANAQAVKPFGAIDTPSQGGMASGKHFINWGWVLTPQPNNIPVNGTTISLWIDGVKTGNQADYNKYREDIASIFPGYANSNGAVGYFDLDTTLYENGIHAIAWTAVDSAGNTDGIGSRYFSIINPGNPSSTAASNNTPNITLTSVKDLEYLPVSPFTPGQSVKIIKGFEKDVEANENELSTNHNGLNRVVIKELEQIEMHFGENLPAIQGYIMSGNQLRQLPIGSTLDKKTGKFYWSPGPGFYGKYDFIFLIKDAENHWYKEIIEVNIETRADRQ